MRNFLILWRREISAYFVSAAAYVTITVVLVFTGIGFCGTAKLFRGDPLRLDIILFQPLTLWGMVLIVAAVLPTRLFAEEKRNGTIETLMTAPVSEIEVVLAKYMAALAVFVLIFAPTAAYPYILRAFSSGMPPVAVRELMSGYLIFALIGAFYLSVGLLVSSLTVSQVVAAISSFTLICIMFLAGTLTYVFHGRTAAALEYISPFHHILDFSSGVLDTGPIVFYLSGIALMLFATIKVIESRRWT